ncbi:MAG TPA: alpha-glucosidase [Caulobacteraceae bacterium]|nr:alpha-glucosidase [Caulobacteraceae bacterium]
MTEWWRGAVVYQVYPRSFLDSDGDGVGDLPGVAEKLDYIARLGVDAIWLSPFFPSPMKDFGYDVSNYRDVDPRFGRLADFDRLLAKAHALGLKVIIDQVWSHTSDQHPWFVESAGSREGARADWYVWADPRPDGTAPNNWLASFGGPAWSWSARRRQYYLHNFLPEQPDLDYWTADVQDAILDVARFWLDRGVDGLRLDVINYIVHDRELRDNPPAVRTRVPATPTQMQRHVHDRSRPEALAFVGRLRSLVDSYAGRMTVGEVVDEPALPRQLEYTAGPDRLHTAYSFYLLAARTPSPALFAQALTSWGEADGWPSWSLGNHDVARFATRLAHDDARLARTLTAILLTLRGTIFLFQGEELALPDAKVPFERLQDPFAIASYDGGAGRDGARTPMPWASDAPMAGFSSAADTWLPIDPRHLPLAVDRQEADAESHLAFTRALVAMRRASRALRLGRADLVEAPDGVLAFERAAEGERVLCVFELSGRPARVDGRGEILAAWRAELQDGAVSLDAYGGAILRLGSRTL